MQNNSHHSFSDPKDSSRRSSPKHAASPRRPLASRGRHAAAAQEAALDGRGIARAFLCVLLSIVLVFGLVPEASITAAFATDDEESSELVEAEEADVEEEAADAEEETDSTDEIVEADESNASEEADASEEDAEIEVEAVADDEAEEDEVDEAEEAEEASDDSEEASYDDEESADDGSDDDAAADDAADTDTDTVSADSEDDAVYDLDYVEGEIIIVYEDDALDLDEELDVDVDSEAVVELVGEDADEVTLEDVGVVEQEEVATTSDDEGTVVVAQLDEDVSVEDVIEAIEDDPDIAYVQPNYSYSILTTTTDDPYLSDDTSSFYNQYYLFESGFTEAWDYVTVEGSVTIAVLDTGCNLEHEDLQDNLDVEHAYDVTTGTLLSESKVANNGDADGHGTQVCGIIAALADNGIGIAGASYNATVLPVKVFDSSGNCTTLDVVAAYSYLAELIDSGELDDLRVVNMSIGTYTSGESATDLLMEEAIADLLEEYDVLTVCAGGNGDGEDAYTAYCYPADFEVCVSVTSVDMDGSNSSYSDYNDAKDISAYGEKILTTSAKGGYVRSTGTSMAAPQVTAAIALVWAANPTLTSSEVIEILQDTATEVTGNKHSSSGSAGIIDVEAAVLAALGIEEDSSSSSSSGSSSSSEDEVEEATVSYRVHCQTYGWLSWVSNGTTAGTTGLSKRMEAIKITVDSELEGSIVYRVHCQTYGWTDWVSDGELAGTTNQSKRMEAIQIKLTGELAEEYDVYYRVHCQTYGWTGWACNGEACGTGGLSKRAEAIQIVLVEKGGDAPGSTSDTYYTNYEISYRVHRQTYGWTSYLSDGATAGTTGLSKRAEAIQIKLSSAIPYDGSITYRVHCQTYGWMSWVSEGSIAGTTGLSKRMEAIQIKLTGEVAEYYDVYYRVHVQGYGWLDWACNGESAGTTGLSKRIEAIQIVLVEKGGDAPGDTDTPYIKG